MQKFAKELLLITAVLSFAVTSSAAATEITEDDVISRSTYVTSEMCKPSFWAKDCDDGILMEKDSIAELNRKIWAEKETHTYDLVNYPEEYDMAGAQDNLADVEIPEDEFILAER